MPVAQPIDSEQVLFKEGVERLPITRSDGPLHPVEGEINRPRQIGRPPMKKIMLAVALVLSFAAPAVAGTSDPYWAPCDQFSNFGNNSCD
jgi:hypothetical protein